jgi:protein disulfide-isomerase A6
MNYEEKYLKYKAKYLSLKNKKSMSGGGNDKIKVILFKADWCGHCKHFKPTWEAISKQYNNKYEFIVYDADKQKEHFKEYNVDAFPTVIVKNGNKLMNYEGDRSVDDFSNFLQNIN